MIDAKAGAAKHNIHQVLSMNPMHYYHTPIKPISTQRRAVRVLGMRQSTRERASIRSVP